MKAKKTLQDRLNTIKGVNEYLKENGIGTDKDKREAYKFRVSSERNKDNNKVFLEVFNKDGEPVRLVYADDCKTLLATFGLVMFNFDGLGIFQDALDCGFIQ